MLGRVPLKHRITVWVLGLLSFAGLGAWLGLASPSPLVWPSTAVVSAALGALAVTLFLHQLEPQAQRH